MSVCTQTVLASCQGLQTFIYGEIFLGTCACILALPSDHFKTNHINMSPHGNLGVKDCILQSLAVVCDLGTPAQTTATLS